MRTLTKIEKQYFIKLFNSNGYVLDFSNCAFSQFALNSVGIDIQNKYGGSKGAALTQFIYVGKPHIVNQLLTDLIEYYPLADLSQREFEENEVLYEKCKNIVDEFKQEDKIRGSFYDTVDSEYIENEIESMTSAIKRNPTEAIGKAKELIESCCKTILDNKGIEYAKNNDVAVLVGLTMENMKITPNNISETVPESKAIKAILGNLRAIAQNVAILRNAYGSGHGKSANYKGLEERHARLAVGSSVTLVNFLWDSYLNHIRKG